MASRRWSLQWRDNKKNFMKNKEIKKHFLPGKVSRGRKGNGGGPLGMGRWGFMASELAQFVYAAVTALVILFTWTGLEDPQTLLWQRMTFLSGTIVLWVAYWLWPCRFVILCRVTYLLFILGSWYPDTYDINSQFGCLDHLFADYEQRLFGMQPALWFSRIFNGKVVSELMYAGYFSYYFFFVVILVYLYFRDYGQLERASYIIFGSFFVCYSIYLALPVVGPQYYYLAVGTDEIAKGSFPDVGTYFAHSTDALKAPGWDGGLFYNLMTLIHNSGERPTAAFPSSHVAIATLVMMMAARLRAWRYFLCLALPYVFLCLSTVYIMAHYAIDVIAGLAFGVALFFLFGGMRLHKVA